MLANGSSPTHSNTSTTSSSAASFANVPTPAPIGIIAGASVGGAVVLALIVSCLIIFLRRRRAAKDVAATAAVQLDVHAHAELPNYREYKDNNAVEVSDFSSPLVFTSYQPTHPVEMDATEEAQDQWRPLNLGFGAGTQSPAMTSPSRFSEVSLASSPGSLPVETAVAGRSSRQSRQSDVSRDSN
jgi:hypothetical protein